MCKVPARLLVLRLSLPPCRLRALQSFHGVLLYFQPGIMLPEHAAKPQAEEARKTLGRFGLRGMRERAKLIGGKPTVWSELDAGTEVELSIPAARAYTAPSEGQPMRLTDKIFAKLSGRGTAKKS